MTHVEPPPTNSAPRLALRCPCGLQLTGTGEPALLSEVRNHLAERHPDLVGRYADEDVLGLSYRLPARPA